MASRIYQLDKKYSERDNKIPAKTPNRVLDLSKEKNNKVVVVPTSSSPKSLMPHISGQNKNKSKVNKGLEEVDYDKLKIVKVFGGRHNSEYVYLLENDIIKKKYSPENPQHVDHFKREIKILTHLRKCPFVTKLLKVDHKNLIMYQTYCGPRPEKTRENAKKIQQRAHELHKKWGVVRRQGDSAPIYNIFFGNTGIKNGEIYFFDFGGNRWQIE